MDKTLETLKTLELSAKINLTDDEKTAAVEFFEFFTEKFNMLGDVATENVEPLVTVSSLINVMRDDAAYKVTDRETLLENALETNNGYFVVPRILE